VEVSFLKLSRPVSSVDLFQAVSDGDWLSIAVDWYAMEGLPNSLVVATATFSLKNKKGTFGNQGMKRLLGQVQFELDCVLVGLVSKPKHRRSWYFGPCSYCLWSK
jgi:hypothetical protein